MERHPQLWSFRRCPYAIRARLAILSAGARVELREILLRRKPEAFLETSASATVPALRLADRVLDESLDIMIWALGQNDPHGLLRMPDEGWGLIAQNDGPFKAALDHTKYASRYPELEPETEREKASDFLFRLNEQLAGRSALFGDHLTIADFALLPFVRQFANIDIDRFRAQDWPDLNAWLERFVDSEIFAQAMIKLPVWSEGDPPTWFGGEETATLA